MLPIANRIKLRTKRRLHRTDRTPAPKPPTAPHPEKPRRPQSHQAQDAPNPRPGSPAAAPRDGPGTPCEGSRDGPRHRPAHPPAPQRPTRPADAPQTGSCRPTSPPQDAPGTTDAAAHTTAEPPQDEAAQQAPHEASIRATPAATPAARPATLGASNSVRMPSSTSSTARTRLIRRVARSECPPSSKKLSSIPTASTPRTSPNRPHRISSCGVRGPRREEPRRLRRRQRTAVKLAVRRQRKRVQHDDRRRHQVLRQTTRQRGPKQTAVQTRTGAPGAHHVADQTPLPRAVLPDHDRRLRHTRLAKQRRLDLARLDPVPAKLDLRIRTTQELQHAVRTPARQVPGPVHPAPSRAMRVRDKPLRRQTRTPQVAPRNPKTRDVQLPRHTRRQRLETRSQNINPRVPDRTADRQAMAHALSAVRSSLRKPLSPSDHRR